MPPLDAPPSAAVPGYGADPFRDLMASPDEAARLKAGARDLLSWDLTPRQLLDVELLLTGACAPLRGFLGPEDFDGVVERMRLADGTFWPIPLTLDVTEPFAGQLATGQRIALRDPEGVLVAVMEVDGLFRPDLPRAALAVHGTASPSHPGVRALLHDSNPVCVGGRLQGVELPRHYDFVGLRRTPRETRERFARKGWRKVLGVHTDHPMHRAEVERATRAAQRAQANLLVQAAVGLAHAREIDPFTRVRCIERVMRHFPEGSASMGLLPLAARYAGPREALWHAIVARNFGCSHFLVVRDHGSPPDDGSRAGVHPPAAAIDLAVSLQKDLGIAIVPGDDLVYVEDRDEFCPAGEARDGERALKLAPADLRRRLDRGLDIPKWFSYPEVIGELRRTWRPRERQGVTIFFTGLSGAGKSTIANALLARILEHGDRTVTLLDGDIVRKNLSSELGFSRAHRDLNILRIGFVASEITKHGGIAICAPIAPYAATRGKVREMVSAVGGFIEVYVSTSIEVCESRDRKGLYAKARAGLIKEFTGVSDPYEVPDDAEIVIDTAQCTPLEAAQVILNRLEADGYIR